MTSGAKPTTSTIGSAVAKPRATRRLTLTRTLHASGQQPSVTVPSPSTAPALPVITAQMRRNPAAAAAGVSRKKQTATMKKNPRPAD